MLKEDNTIGTFEIEELIMHVLGIDPDDEDYEDKICDGLYENYYIEDPDSLYRFIRQITPLIDKQESGMTNKLYKGFAKVEDTSEDGSQLKRWLLKIPA